jgi:hypothetical protein
LPGRPDDCGPRRSNCSDRVLAPFRRIVDGGSKDRCPDHDGDADGPTMLDTFAWHSWGRCLEPARAAILSKSPTANLRMFWTTFGESPGHLLPKKAGQHAAKLIVKNIDHFLPDVRLKAALVFGNKLLGSPRTIAGATRYRSSQWSADYVEQSQIYNHAQRRRGLRRHRPRGRCGSIRCQRKFANGHPGVA